MLNLHVAQSSALSLSITEVKLYCPSTRYPDSHGEATTSREAVSIMGALAEEYGFCGASDSFEGGAESLMVTDPNEAWSFHILAGPDVAYDSRLGDKAEHKNGAVWVAARVCDECVTVTANMFAIREIDLADTANFLGTSNMWEIAAEHGYWKQGDPYDFTATFSDGEYAHKYYSGRRMWGVYRLLASELGLSPDYGNLKEDHPYPFQAAVSGDVKKTGGVGPEDIFAVMRDYYNQTRFSLGAPSTGGGPWGSVDRMGYNDPASKIQVDGNWERSIGLWRTAESYIVQSGAAWLVRSPQIYCHSWGWSTLAPRAHYTRYMFLSLGVAPSSSPRPLSLDGKVSTISPLTSGLLGQLPSPRRSSGLISFKTSRQCSGD